MWVRDCGLSILLLHIALDASTAHADIFTLDVFTTVYITLRISNDGINIDSDVDQGVCTGFGIYCLVCFINVIFNIHRFPNSWSANISCKNACIHKCIGILCYFPSC